MGAQQSYFGYLKQFGNVSNNNPSIEVPIATNCIYGGIPSQKPDHGHQRRSQTPLSNDGLTQDDRLSESGSTDDGSTVVYVPRDQSPVILLPDRTNPRTPASSKKRLKSPAVSLSSRSSPSPSPRNYSPPAFQNPFVDQGYSRKKRRISPEPQDEDGLSNSRSLTSIGTSSDPILPPSREVRQRSPISPSLAAAYDEKFDSWKREQEAQNRDQMLRLFSNFRMDVTEKCDEMMGDMSKRLEDVWWATEECCEMVRGMRSRLEETQWSIGRVALTQEELQDNCRIIARELDDFRRAINSNHSRTQDQIGDTTQTPRNLTRTLLSMIYPDDEITRLMEEQTRTAMKERGQTSTSASLQRVAKRKCPPSPVDTELSLANYSSSSRSSSPVSPTRTSFFSTPLHQALAARDEAPWRTRSLSGDTLYSTGANHSEIAITKLTESPTPILEVHERSL